MYSNGNFHHHWEVRQVLAQDAPCVQSLEAAPCAQEPDAAPCGQDAGAATGCVKYKVLAGANRRRSFTCSSEEFLRWARYEVARDENSWFKV